MAQDFGRLVEQASRGEPVAVEELLRLHLPGLRAFIRLRTGDLIRAQESCSDLAQSVCREVLQHMDRFQYRGEAGFKDWLYATALRKIMNRYEYYRAGKRDVRKLDKQEETEAETRLLECYRSFYSPSQQAMHREQLERMEKAFDKMPEEYRDVIVLTKLVGLSPAEVASKMNRSIGATRMLLVRALADLSGYLGP